MKTTEQIIEHIQSTLSGCKHPVALHEPCFKGNEWEYVKECIDTNWVSSVGKFVDRFEHDLSQLTGAKHVIATVNGTAALHVAYLLAGITQGDEVLVPTLTFVGTVNPLMYCGAIPHFIDADEKTLGIDHIALDDYLKTITYQKNNACFNRYTDRPIKALCVMHTIGHPVDLDPLEELCQKYHIKLIEDAAEALGSYYKGTHVGHRGIVGTLSFNGNKIITTGGGGAILTNDPELGKRAKHITTTAKLPHPWLFQHDAVAYNYRLPNLNAALGCAQLELLPKFIEHKRLLAKKYQSKIIPGITFVKEPEYAKSNYWLNAFVLDEKYLHLQDVLLQALNSCGIMTRPLWNLQHTLPMYKDCPKMPLPIAESLKNRVIKVPSSVSLST